MARNNEPIAIIGSACRFAGGVDTPSKLWDLLRQPRDVLQEIPESRFNPDGFYNTDGSYHGRANVRHAYFLEESPSAFDAEFFGLKPVEAKATDPQQRVLMEVAYEALENAGLPLDDMRGSNTGVYVGAMCYDYGALAIRDLSDIPIYTATGTAASLLSNRLSYFFDWHGPSLTIDTACSSSLVAVHLAIQALRAGECTTALSCGSNLILGPENFVIESKLKMLSPDGRSRMWDQNANGYARGEGVGVLVLKPLSAALRDNDPIECVIRETALNQDGAFNSAGITIPNSSAQELLIRATYTKAGLDLGKPEDQPQFFEAHGTGTLVGDPAEAEAIYNTFSKGYEPSDGSKSPLYVGSIKTVLGHTESTAGLAGLMKASLALNRGVVPPNMLFSQLSSQVAPFYKGIEIPLSAKPWPQAIESSGKRRASVNSFGFGGANAHAILESYNNPSKTQDHIPTFAPYVFSAASNDSLRESLLAYNTFLDGEGSEANPRDLSWTLRQRRSTLSHRISFPESSISDLKANISSRLADSSATTKGLPATRRGRILGVFTGQGAQYPRMGAELIEKSAVARAIIEQLEKTLAELPDSPDWSLLTEILADSSSSRVHEAAISQPLCTAIQILQVDILRLAGIEFDAVVGHSSGEIAAAYAAGDITANDAMRIAYYRGVHLQHAPGLGAMMAVGGTATDLEELCEDPVFAGRISIAAYNSSESFTVSGDEDAIKELQVLLNDEGTFNRLLRVDKAYHSRHMLPCSEPYVESLRACGIQVQRPSSTCTWVSSVHGRPVELDMDLAGRYWTDNMMQPVLFSQALESAFRCSDSTFDLAIELGPHPALKGPSIQTIQKVNQHDIPYTGVLIRGTSAVEASSAALGFAWTRLEKGRVDLDSYDRALSGVDDGFSFVTNLPTYSWNHKCEYLHESRISRRLRTRKSPVHCLLGDATPDSAVHHMSWRNVLRVSELEWMSGHRVQGQILFPAAGYLVTALEAARSVAKAMGKDIHLIDIGNFVVHQAVVFDTDDTGIETLTQLAKIVYDEKMERIRGSFTYSAALPSNPDELTLAASGNLDIRLGAPSSTLLPARKADLPHMIDVEAGRFYQALAELGYEFSGHFKALTQLRRRHLRSSCLVNMQLREDLIIHPAGLDAVLQACILAYSYPYDERLRTPHLPTNIDRIRVNPAVLLDPECGGFQDASCILDASIRENTYSGSGICGDVNMYPGEASYGAIQIQGANFLPMSVMGEQNDRKVFSKVHWINSALNGSVISETIPLTEEHQRLLNLLERISTFYMRKFDKSIALDNPLRSEFPHNYYLNYCHHLTTVFESGEGKWGQPEWLHDSLEDILEASREYAGIVDVEIMHLVGAQMSRVFRGETTMLEEFRADGSVGVLDRYYAEGYGLRESAQWISRAVRQIVDRYPHMNILEIGAGTGGATKRIFREIGQSFRSYTYTDISAAFFENASHTFAQQRDRMIFKTFDAEKEPQQQGYVEGTYDMIVAFFVIHATSNLERALRNIRKLLRPGGFLVVGEGQDSDNTVTGNGFIFGTLPGWWLGAKEDGRILSPLVSPTEWGHLLRKTGFSGADISVPESWAHLLKAYHFVTQAVDDQVQFLREPLAPSGWRIHPIEKLVIVGGQTGRSSHLVDGLKSVLGGEYATTLYTAETLTDIDYEEIVDTNTTVLALTELDKPVFKDITPETFAGLRKMFESGKQIFWVTSGRLDTTPFCNMTVGFGRVAVSESPDLYLQMLDVPDPENVQPQTIAELFLRFCVSKFQDRNLLWSLEPEIVMDHEGRQLVPRLVPISELNNRYNSGMRTITQEKDISESPVVLRASSRDHGYIINNTTAWEASVLNSPINTDDLVELHISFAIYSAIRTPFGHKFLVLGERSADGTSFLALSPSLASLIQVPLRAAVPVQVTPGSDQDMLSMVGARLVARTILDPLFPGQTVVVQNATESLSRSITVEANARDIDVVFVAESTQTIDIPEPCVKLPKYATHSDLSDLLPADPVAYVNLGDYRGARAKDELDITPSLPPGCKVETAKTLFSSSGNHSRPSSASILGEILNKALHPTQRPHIQEQLLSKEERAIDLVSIAAGVLPNHPLTVIELRNGLVPVQASRLDTQPIFKGVGHTYWIVGMTGALGVSLCDWIITKGAKNVVITSRRPDISPDWIAAHKRGGATVMVIPCDITKERDLIAVHKKICQSLPPITGVINGAMVLRDVAIRNMTFEQLKDVTQPKVEGSIYLDRIFYNTNLDFFVLVSSINCVIGSWGQANYAAANMFMCGLAGERRKRGLRASVANVGAIIGAGYMERETRQTLDAIVQKLHMMRMSEEDWHQAIAEAIDVSRLESVHGPEITTGLSSVPFDIPIVPTWFSNPKFSAFITDKKPEREEMKGVEGTSSIQDMLQSCSSKQELCSILQSAFSSQLRTILQVSMSDEELMASRSSEIGLDSLVSVDIRSWFLKSLQVNMPALKIMGNNTMASLVEFAMEAMPASVTPQIDVSDASEAGEASTIASSAVSGLDVMSTPAVGIESRSTPECHTPLVFQHIDWDSESAPLDSWASLPLDSTLPPSNPPQAVVLTGVTGLLGHHLLEYILKHTSVVKVHCLAVRKLARRLQDNDLLVDPRVEYHAGNLSDPFLGLSEYQARSIFATIDVVIHNGADTSHTKFYHGLRDSNVGSTRVLAGLCIPRRIPFHYISSAGVALYHNQAEFPEVSVTSPGSTPPPINGDFGYGCSKWVNERFLEQTHAQFGLPIYIYRPSTIIREGSDASVARAELDWVNALLHYVRKLGAAPQMKYNHGALDLVKVETCCNDVLRNITSGGSMLDTDPQYVNQVGDTVIGLDRLRHIDEEESKLYDLLPMQEWVGKAVEAGLHPSVAMLVEEMDMPGRPNYPKLLRGQRG